MRLPCTIPVAERRIINNPITPPVSSYSAGQITEPNIPGGISNLPTSSSRTIFSKGVLILLVVLALLVVITSLGFFFLLGANRTNNTPDVAATTHANDATSFAASATAQHTSTVTQTSTANSPLTFPPPAANLVLNDPLADNSHGYRWETKPDPGGVCKFTNGAYQVNENHQEIEYCPAHNTSFGSNFAYQVQMTMVQGDEGGLIVQDGNHGISYYFVLGQDGNYKLDYYTSKSPTHLSTGFASSYHTGFGQSNLIQVIVTSNNLALYVNNQFVQNVSINTYGPGYIGVFAEDTQNPTEAIFSNAEVWKF